VPARVFESSGRGRCEQDADRVRGSPRARGEPAHLQRRGRRAPARAALALPRRLWLHLQRRRGRARRELRRRHSGALAPAQAVPSPGFFLAGPCSFRWTANARPRRADQGRGRLRISRSSESRSTRSADIESRAGW